MGPGHASRGPGHASRGGGGGTGMALTDGGSGLVVEWADGNWNGTGFGLGTGGRGTSSLCSSFSSCLYLFKFSSRSNTMLRTGSDAIITCTLHVNHYERIFLFSSDSFICILCKLSSLI